MQNINRVLITGNLTRDPELRTFEGGGAVCNMRVAVNSRIKRDGEWVDKPNYFDVATFGKNAENCNKYLSRGRPIAVDGRLDWREFEHNGQTRQAVQIIADSIQFLDSGERGERQRDDDIPVHAGDFSPTAASADDDIPF